MYTLQILELEELGFKHSGNIRKPHEWFIVTDSVRIRYFDNSGLLEITELGLIPSIRAYRPGSLEDVKSVLMRLTPNIL